jgi:hypothetical protein
MKAKKETMSKVDMLDKLTQELTFVENLFRLIEYAAEDQASCDAICEVSHRMSYRMQDLGQFVENELAHAVGVNLPENIAKLTQPHETLSNRV